MSEQPEFRTVTGEAGRPCPYCRFALKPGAEIAVCSRCRAAHHAECWTDNGACAIAGCAQSPSGPAEQRATSSPAATASNGPINQTPPPRYQRDALHPGPTGPLAPQAPRPASRSLDRGLVVAVLAVIVAAGAVAAALVVTLNNHANRPRLASASAHGVTQPRPSSAKTGSAPGTGGTAAVHNKTTGSGTTGNGAGSASTSQSTANSGALPEYPSPTGQDTNGYNIGPGCSDNPNSPLPGCSDSPSIPAGDPSGSCPNDITLDALTTTCGLAENLRANYRLDGTVTAVSPETGQTFAFTCLTGGAGTTGYTICEAEDGARLLYARWPS
jgi:hypothetical protein